MIRWLHRYLGLVVAVIWLAQAGTGLIIVFGRDIGHSFAPHAPQAFEAAAFSAALQDFAASAPQRKLEFVLAADPDQRWFDVLYHDGAGPTWYARADGHGDVIYQRPFESSYPSPGFYMTAIHLHETFLNADVGQTLVGISGLFLLTSLALGVQLAWPRAGRWAQVLRPRRGPTEAATLHTWHRALGLWLAVPAIALVTAGMLVAIGEPLQDALGGSLGDPSVAAKAVATHPPTLADALHTAMAQFPGATLSVASMPREDRPWYRIRLRQPAEIRRIFGTTSVWIDARDGSVLAVHDALAASAAVAFFDGLYPFHSGEIAGLGGRLFVLVVGVWLSAMILLGNLLWWRRTR